MFRNRDVEAHLFAIEFSALCFPVYKSVERLEVLNMNEELMKELGIKKKSFADHWWWKALHKRVLASSKNDSKREQRNHAGECMQSVYNLKQLELV